MKKYRLKNNEIRAIQITPENGFLIEFEQSSYSFSDGTIDVKFNEEVIWQETLNGDYPQEDTDFEEIKDVWLRGNKYYAIIAGTITIINKNKLEEFFYEEF